jgi:hypothetical protein
LKKARQAMAEHCYVTENNRGLASYTTKTNMHIIAYVVMVLNQYFNIIAQRRHFSQEVFDIL